MSVYESFGYLPCRNWMRLLLIVPFVLCTYALSLDARQAEPDRAKRAFYAARELQRWYIPQTGLYQKPTDWWNSANAITALVDYSRVTHSTLYLPTISNTFLHANKAYGITNFVNDSNDDAGWWAMAWIGAYDLTHRAEYLKMAETIFADLATQWDEKTCGGGVWWSKDLQHSAYKNAVTNELFLEISASLANRVKNKARHAEYLNWSHKEWQWFRGSGMINPANLVNDGLDRTNPAACINNGGTTWTYNQGVILGGLAELYKADNNPELLTKAHQIAHAAMLHLTTADGILQEPPGNGPDWPQFKGIFMRNLARLYQVAPDVKYQHFAQVNANSIWNEDRAADGYQFGKQWQGPFDVADATRQTSALDALLAALEMP